MIPDKSRTATVCAARRQLVELSALSMDVKMTARRIESDPSHVRRPARGEVDRRDVGVGEAAVRAGLEARDPRSARIEDKDRPARRIDGHPRGMAQAEAAHVITHKRGRVEASIGIRLDREQPAAVLAQQEKPIADIVERDVDPVADARGDLGRAHAIRARAQGEGLESGDCRVRCSNLLRSAGEIEGSVARREGETHRRTRADPVRFERPNLADDSLRAGETRTAGLSARAGRSPPGCRPSERRAHDEDCRPNQ